VILVRVGTGFVGIPIVQELLEQGSRVIVTIHKGSVFPKLLWWERVGLRADFNERHLS